VKKEEKLTGAHVMVARQAVILAFDLDLKREQADGTSGSRVYDVPSNALGTQNLPNAQAKRRAQRVRSSLLFGGTPVPPRSWQKLELPRKTRADSDRREVATVCRQYSVDAPSLGDSGDYPVDQPEVELGESSVELEGANNVGR
jgi:hypothetical protein